MSLLKKQVIKKCLMDLLSEPDKMPRLYHLLCLILICALQTACASTKFNVLEINSLASQTSGTGEFEGLEYMAKRAPITATKRINIIFLHGIGWVENPLVSIIFISKDPIQNHLEHQFQGEISNWILLCVWTNKFYPLAMT